MVMKIAELKKYMEFDVVILLEELEKTKGKDYSDVMCYHLNEYNLSEIQTTLNLTQMMVVWRIKIGTKFFKDKLSIDYRN